jgi:predicted amidohydrolase
MRVEICQFSGNFDRKAQRLAFMTAAIAAAAERSADLLLFAELSVTGWCNSHLAADDAELITGPSVELLRGLARQHSIGIVFGLPERAAAASERTVLPAETTQCHAGEATQLGDFTIFNTTVFVGKTGTVLLRHRKTHPYDDYEKKVFTCGGKVSDVVPFMGFSVGIACCFELEFPEYVRSLRLRGADFILAPSACADDFVVHRMVSTRAFENSCFVAYVNAVGRGKVGEHDLCFNGASSIAGPDGRDVLRMPYVEASTTAAARLKVPTMVSGEDWVKWTTEPRDDAFHTAFVPSTAETVPFDAHADLSLSGLPISTRVLRGVTLPGRGFAGAAAHLADHIASAPYMSSRRPWLYDGCTAPSPAVMDVDDEPQEVPFTDEDLSS